MGQSDDEDKRLDGDGILDGGSHPARPRTFVDSGKEII
jgi:hypothetical protein